MKELSIEEKAKAYDKVREKIVVRFGTNVAEEIFSEFEESEDEKIRKGLIKLVKATQSDELWCEYCVPKVDALAWLEKQGETYTKKDVDNAYLEGMAFAKDELEKQAEVVSDKDDIEAEEKGIRKAFNKIWKEKQDKQKSQRMISAEAKEAMYGKPSDKIEPKFKVGDKIIRSSKSSCPVHDSTDDTICKVAEIHDTCYILDTKEGKVQEPFIWQDYYKLVVQEPAWSEEDETILTNIIIMLEVGVKNYFIKDNMSKVIIWLKSLKDRVQPQNLTVTDEEIAQAKKDAYNDALDKIEYHSGEPNFDDGWSAAIWYLKKRNALPRSQWKPSDEQITALETTLYTNMSRNDERYSVLSEFVAELKKLKEE